MPDNEPESAAAEPAVGPGIGERLRAARARRGLSADQLAEHLRLDESVIVALEADDFDALGAPVFVRGHLKTCARFLELDVDELLGDYAAAVPEPVVRPPATAGGSGAPITINLAPWGAGLLGVLMAIGLTVYLLQGDPEPAAGSAASESGTDATPAGPASPPIAAPVATPPPLPADRDTAQAPPVVAAGRESAVDTPLPPPPAPTPVEPEGPEPEARAPAEVAAAGAAPAPVADASASRELTLYFRGESWTEISDRNGRLLFGLQREGIRRELNGEAPFKLLLGNAAAVDLYLDGEPFDLPAGSTRGKVARFVIEPEPGRNLP